jgi:hypothetical protein
VNLRRREINSSGARTPELSATESAESGVLKARRR